MTTPIYLKRIYDLAESGDGTRVLVDGLWPRGVRKTEARIDIWLKEVAPSRELRQWFKHDRARWPAFAEAYRDELAAKPDAVRPLLDALERGPVTLLFAARDRAYNHAVVLRDHVTAMLAKTASGRPADEGG